MNNWSSIIPPRDPVLRYLWFQEHKWFKPVIVGLFFLLVVCVIIAVVKSGWNGLPTWISGIALGFFAWLTYRHSKQVAEAQYVPLLQLYSVNKPETRGPLVEKAVTKNTDIEYDGVRWRVNLWNPASIPIMTDQLTIEIGTASGPWTSISNFSEVLDDKGNNLLTPSRPIIVQERGNLSVAILICKDECKEFLSRKFGDQKEFKLMLRLYQCRQFQGQDKSMWRSIVSEPFALPEKFSRKIQPRGGINL